MKLIDDTLKSRGKWSVGRLTMLISFLYQLAASGFATYKSGAMADIPTNWLALIVMTYGINKAGQCNMAGKPQEQA